MEATQSEKDSFLQEFDRIVLRLTGEVRQTPVDIGDWLGRLLLLYGVPFQYLVPQEDMLPPESIRFFYLDPGWMKCLLEGACSVGRSSMMDDILDQHLRNHFLDHAGKKAREVRAGGQGDLHWPLSGFLLRSLVVEGWQGLEMQAAGVDGQGNRLDPLEPLRIDRLSPEIMLCIFNGKVTDIEITQPPEGMHFGASAKGNNAYQKLHLRKLFPAGEAGDSLDQASVPVTDVPMRPGVQRVIDIQSLANQMHSKLNAVQAIDGTANGRFTSAEFGVQMVESPGKAIFTVKGSGTPL
jgi:hypothetical protein